MGRNITLADGIQAGVDWEPGFLKTVLTQCNFHLEIFIFEVVYVAIFFGLFLIF